MDHAHEETQNPFGVEPIGRLILKFAIPSVIALLVNSLYNIVDQVFIGWGVGYLGNRATNIVFPITIVALALAMMIGNGGAAFLSLKLGEGELEDARKGVGNAVTLVTVVSVVLTLVFLTGFQTIAAVYLQAVGKPVKSAILSLARQIIFFVPAALLLPLALGVDGVLWTGPVADGLAFILSLVFLVYERTHLQREHRKKTSNA